MSTSNVRAIAVTKPLIEDVSTPQELLAYFARVSSTQNQLNHETGPKLIKSLVKRQEWSPLDMVNLVVEIVTTRDVARQILRHWSLKPQEFSQRYAMVQDDPIFREARLQHPTDRQASIETDDPELQADWLQSQQEVWDKAIAEYNRALERGVAKEVARAVLPEGLTPSRTYFNGTVRSWYHYCELRKKLSTQKEHRLIAEAVWDILASQFPDIVAES